MLLKRGISWAMPNGQWRKEDLTVDLDTAEAPDGLTHAQKVAYVSLDLEIDLMTLKWFYGGMSKEDLDTTIEHHRALQQQITSVIA